MKKLAIIFAVGAAALLGSFHEGSGVLQWPRLGKSRSPSAVRGVPCHGEATTR